MLRTIVPFVLCHLSLITCHVCLAQGVPLIKATGELVWAEWVPVACDGGMFRYPGGCAGPDCRPSGCPMNVLAGWANGPAGAVVVSVQEEGHCGRWGWYGATSVAEAPGVVIAHGWFQPGSQTCVGFPDAGYSICGFFVSGYDAAGEPAVWGAAPGYDELFPTERRPLFGELCLEGTGLDDATAAACVAVADVPWLGTIAVGTLDGVPFAADVASGVVHELTPALLGWEPGAQVRYGLAIDAEGRVLASGELDGESYLVLGRLVPAASTNGH